MNSRHNHIIKVISVIVLCFFTWTFGGAFEIAYAIKNSSQHTVDGSQGNPTKNTQKAKPQKSEEKFQKTIENIEAVLNDPATDTNTRKNKLKAKKSEIEGLDIDIKKEFAETEKKLKNEGLPPEILERHYNFVKNYNKNYKDLKDNLDAIDRGKDKSETDAAIENTKRFLENVKPPKKHKPLDPNKLPHRTMEPVFTDPRTSPEQFTEGVVKKAKSTQNKPILIASSGSLDGLLAANNEPILLAAANPPTSADLAQTIEVQFTPAIQAKAAELNHNPTKIYNWVRNNIEYIPTYGSIQGANMCLQTKQCNDFDTASLLIALLRASGIHARYVYGTIELPIDKVKNWVGGFTDTNSTMNFIASGRIPVSGLTSGGKIEAVRMEHVWVEAWIDMVPSLGAVHKQGDTWIPLDASFKQYTYKPGIDFHTDMAIGGEQYINDYIDSNGINPETIDSPSQFYFKRFFDIYANKYPDLWTWDIFGSDKIETSKLIETQNFEILFETLPYKVVAKGWVNSVLPDAYSPKVNISLTTSFDPGVLLQFSSKVADIAGKEMTLSFIPASDKDQALLQLYGNNIFSVPAYLLEMRPVLKLNGIAVVTGSPIGLGTQIELIVENVEPSHNNIEIDIITVGDYIAITMVSYSTEFNYVADKMAGLSKKILASYGIGTVPDDLIGTFLYSIGVMYFHRLSFDEKIVAINFKLAALRKFGRAIITAEAEPECIFGVPLRIVKGGISIDADRNLYSVSALDGNRSREKDFMIVTGIGSSDWESRVFQILTGTPSVSAAVLLKAAKLQNMQIYNVEIGNINAIMPSIEVYEEVKQDIRNAVNAGKKVIVPKTNILYNGYSGVGYIIIDPVTGGGAYMIAGGLAGGRAASDPRDWSAFQTIFTRKAIVELAWSLEGYPYVYGAEGYPDPKCGFDCSGFIHYLYVTVYGPGIWGTNPDGTYIIRPSLKQIQQICTVKNWWHPYIDERLSGDILFSNLKQDGYHHGNIIDENIDYSWSAAGGPCYWPPWNITLPGWDLPEECRAEATLWGYWPICKDSKVKRTRNEDRLDAQGNIVEEGLKGGHSDQICRPVP